MNATYRFNFVGGIASPGDLLIISKAAKAAEVAWVRFGLRQQLFVTLDEAYSANFTETLKRKGIGFQTNDNDFPNIVSSYVGEEVFQKGNWLSEGIYKDIFDSFEREITLKINISDAQQSFSPFFSGHLNFVASEKPNFWFLYLRLPKTNEVHCYTRLVYSLEIAQICYGIEACLEQNPKPEIQTVFASIAVRISENPTDALQLPNFNLPYYEGFNRYGSRSWLGIYRRNETFSVDFLIELCQLCRETGVAEVCLTPWKSIIIKGISEADRSSWSKLLSRYSINVRHAANELNWQVEDNSETALKLKKNLVKYLNKHDIRTFGLCFGIKTIPKTEVFASIMVRRRLIKFFGVLPLCFVYDISFTKNFDPNGRDKIYFIEGVLRYQLNDELRAAIGIYNRTADFTREVSQVKSSEKRESLPKTEVHQCSVCFTVYDSNFGDELNDIPAGVLFENLDENYSCSVCESPKSSFTKQLQDAVLANE